MGKIRVFSERLAFLDVKDFGTIVVAFLGPFVVDGNVRFLGFLVLF